MKNFYNHFTNFLTRVKDFWTKKEGWVLSENNSDTLSSNC